MPSLSGARARHGSPALDCGCKVQHAPIVTARDKAPTARLCRLTDDKRTMGIRPPARRDPQGRPLL